MPLFVISQETCSSGTCLNDPGDRGDERLGNDRASLLHFQAQTSRAAATQCSSDPAGTAVVAQIDSGDCSAKNSCQCIPDAGTPQSIGDFGTDKTLKCTGENSCNTGSSSSTGFFEMNEPSPLVCGGKNSCEQKFNVQNVGSMCVTGNNAANGNVGTFILADADPSAPRFNDVCCSRAIGANNPTCKQATFTNAGSFYCTGDGACDQVQVTLKGDFYCQSKQGCGDQTGTGKDDVYWQWIVSGQHCIRCKSTAEGTDQGSCQKADFRFPETSSKVNIYCTGQKACTGVLLTLSSGTCANIRCDLDGGINTCKDMEVDLQGGSCYASGTAITASDFPTVKGGSTAACGSNKCLDVPETCSPSICCAPDVSNPASVDCSSCTTSTTSGGAHGDPHIHSMHGAHYTLLKEGTFVAWEFNKDLESSGKPETAVHWQLLARYGGKKFRTFAILLLDNSGHKLEFSANDCALRAKEGDHPWHIAKAGLLLADTGGSIQVHNSGIRVQDTTTQNTKSNRTLIDARINFNITDGSHGSRKVASLYTHCIVGDHLNFKITMMQKSDIDSVGGEMGVRPAALKATSRLSLLSHSASSKLRALRTRTDEEFEAKKPWVDLGGTAASETFFQKFKQVSLAEIPHECRDEDVQEARQICAKHLPDEARKESEVFVDCVFDVCHGGGELDAELQADLMEA